MASKNLLSILSALLLWASFPPLNGFPMAFIALIPLLHAIKKSDSIKQAIQIGLLFGFVYNLGNHLFFMELYRWSSWPSIISLIVLYAAFLSLYYGLFAAIAKKGQTPLVIISAWVLCEWLKSIGPFGNPHGTIAYSQAPFLPFIQISDIGGVFLISLVIISINVFLLNFKKYSIHALILFLVCNAYGSWKLIQPNKANTSQRISIIQGNHTQEEKLHSNDWPMIRNTYVQLSKKAIKNHQPNLIIWPETVTPGLNFSSESFTKSLQNLISSTETSIVIGTPIKDKNTYYNSTLIYNKSGVQSIYHKNTLMPFGEYWPYPTFFSKIGLSKFIPETEFTPGSNPPTLSLNSHTYGIGICLESLYANHFRKAVQEGAKLLIVQANNAWFKSSSGAEKQLNFNIFRAIETRRYILQSANTGISAIINTKGSLIKKTPLNTQTILTDTVSLISTISLYSKYGDWVIIPCILILILSLLPLSILEREH